jgi:hypothetical protein
MMKKNQVDLMTPMFRISSGMGIESWVVGTRSFQAIVHGVMNI